MKRKFVASVFAVLIAVSSFAQVKPEIKMGVGPSAGKELRDLFVKIYADAGYTVVFVEFPTARQSWAIESGEVDSLIFTSATAIKNEITKGTKVGFGEKPLFKYEIFGYVMTDRAAELNALASFKGVIIGVTQGNRTQEGAVKSMGAVPEPVVDVNGGIQMLDKKRIDILLAVLGALDDPMKKYGLAGKVVALTKPMIFAEYYHVIQQNKKDIIPKVEASLLKFQKELNALLN